MTSSSNAAATTCMLNVIGIYLISLSRGWRVCPERRAHPECVSNQDELWHSTLLCALFMCTFLLFSWFEMVIMNLWGTTCLMFSLHLIIVHWSACKDVELVGKELIASFLKVPPYENFALKVKAVTGIPGWPYVSVQSLDHGKGVHGFKIHIPNKNKAAVSMLPMFPVKKKVLIRQHFDQQHEELLPRILFRWGFQEDKYSLWGK